MRKTLIFFLLLATLLGSYLIYSYTKKAYPRANIEAYLEGKNILTFLVTGLDKEGKTSFSLFIFLEPTQKKCGLFFINPLTVFERDSPSLEDQGSSSTAFLVPYLESITGLKVNYSLLISEKDFQRGINLLGGITYYFDPTVSTPGKEYFRNVGEFHLYGKEIVDYLALPENPTSENYLARLNKQESILLTIYDRIRELPDFKKEWMLPFEKSLQTELTAIDLFSIFVFLNKNPIVFSIAELPVEPFVEEKSKKELLLAKKEIATVAFTKLKTYLQVEDYKFGELSRTEVLNATDKNGLAKDIKSILNEKQYKVLSVGNGWSEGTEKYSMVVDRSGNTEISYQIANILNITKVRHIIDKELGLDTTVLLGEDFEIKPRK